MIQLLEILIHGRRNYSWSKPDDNTIQLGGYEGGLAAGTIHFQLTKDEAIVNVTTAEQIIPAQHFDINSEEYNLIIILHQLIADYLESDGKPEMQDATRSKRMQNVRRLLQEFFETA